ncbi:hypothetical protein BJX70DRAFT_377570 [Aspergillus crustosus]
MRPTFLLRRTTLAPCRPSPSSTPRIRSRRYESTKPEPSSPQKPDTTSKPDPSSSSAQSPPTPPPPPASATAPAPPTVPTPTSTPPLTSSPSVAQPSPTSLSRTLRDRIQAGPVGKFGRTYSRFQEKRPYTTQLVSSLVIYLCGDLSAQYFFPPEKAPLVVQSAQDEGEDGKGTTAVEEEGEGEGGNGGGGGGGGYDPWRTLRHLTVGIGSSIPSYNWFMFLHNNFNYASKPLSILTKVVVQQIVFTPVFNTYFFSIHSLLSGASVQETYERLKVALPQSIVNSAKFWPAVTAFSFMYVPPQFRNVFSGVIAVGWQTYLSWLNQRAAREVESQGQSQGVLVEVGTTTQTGTGTGVEGVVRGAIKT